MSKKLQGNGMWESSRMMLPEHKEQYNIKRSQQNIIARPDLDDQEKEEITRHLSLAMNCGFLVKLTVFDTSRYVQVVGHIIRFELGLGKILLGHDLKKTWVYFSDITEVVLMKV